MNWFYILIAITMVIGIFYLMRRKGQNNQLEFIDSYRFHPAIRKKLSAKQPLLTDQQLDLVFDGLHDYFYICNQTNNKMISMPSQPVNDAWHEFILFTRAYQQYCKKALGRPRP